MVVENAFTKICKYYEAVDECCMADIVVLINTELYEVIMFLNIETYFYKHTKYKILVLTPKIVHYLLQKSGFLMISTKLESWKCIIFKIVLLNFCCTNVSHLFIHHTPFKILSNFTHFHTSNCQQN